MQDLPTAAELVEAVRLFLEQDVMRETTGRTAFLARVSANVLAIVHREMTQGPAAEAAEIERLKGLLNADGSLEELNRLLCARIAQGAITLETPGLADHLWRTTLDKVAIEQPSYATFRRALDVGHPQAR